MDRFLASVERRAYRMAQLAVRDREEALDLVQESMYSLVKDYGRRPEEEWRLLFYRILQNRIRDWHRRRRVRNRWTRLWGGGMPDREGDPPPDPMDTLPDPDQRSPGEEIEARDRAGALRAALAELPLRQQQAFLLRAWEELSVREAARAMGCSEGSVKTHYARAVHALRGRLEGEEP
jgi:RNA polymerase sigma-70 factor (ECF subfamily)